MAGEHRADLVFALPVVPRRAVLLGALPGWREGLLERGVEIVDDAPNADLVVTTAEQAQRAGRAHRQTIVEGVRRVPARLRREGHVSRLASIPPTGDPKVIFDLGSRHAARYGLANAVTPPELSRRLRNQVAARMAWAGLLPPVQPLAITVSPFGREPALLAALRQLGVLGTEWYMVNALGSAVRRNAVFVFDGGTVPRYVAKFSRVPGLAVQFDRDETGLRIAARHAVTAQRAPTSLGRIELDGGYAASVETAAPGHTLATVLRRTRAHDERHDAIELGARWIRDVGVATATRTGSLRSVIDRLVREVAPRFRLTLPADAIEAAAEAPAVVAHGEVFEEHVVLARDSFTVIDWEHASEHGLPLADLLFYATNVLSALDDPEHNQGRTAHMVDLYAGRSPSSPIAFRWIRDYVTALQLPAEAVGPLATLYWLQRSELSRVERERAERETGGPVVPSWLEQTATAWLGDDALGPDWASWRRS